MTDVLLKVIYNNKVKLVTLVEGEPEGSLFNGYYTKVQERALLLFLECSTLPLIHTL